MGSSGWRNSVVVASRWRNSVIASRWWNGVVASGCWPNGFLASGRWRNAIAGRAHDADILGPTTGNPVVLSHLTQLKIENLLSCGVACNCGLHRHTHCIDTHTHILFGHLATHLGCHTSQGSACACIMRLGHLLAVGSENGCLS